MPVRATVGGGIFVNGDRRERIERVGASLIELIVTTKVCVTVLLVLCPSLTTTEIGAVPLALATGVKVSVPVPFGLV